MNIEALWANYVAAADKAQRSQSIQDGIQAGHAWAEWLKAFTISDDRGEPVRVIQGGRP